ncbi:transporter substrate-binding domain-containing protein [Chondrinema litorale]|uniref:transporter substrate-binding domain-containing protein n=1 Tax=Chondrinema litorale TaxID=2994555 RepID=UPI002543E51E|nr:transporter substrate-binding domain-containing protein [Chondrinema litorale]UZR93411.1 transporter substrate-binding domain-containing protein [Chondrinema litorale]
MQKPLSTSIVFLVLSVLLCGLRPPEEPPNKVKSILNQILDRGYIEVGITADYVPFAYFEPDSQSYQGIDIELAKKLAEDMDVELRFVTTTREQLMSDVLHRNFDVAMSGIARTVKQTLLTWMTTGYFEAGKAILIREKDKELFTSLKLADKPSVKIGVNTGGTNEIFAKQFIYQADIVFFENNLDIPEALQRGVVDIMLTDNIEAKVIADKTDGLFAVDPYHPLNQEVIAFAVPPGDEKWLNFLNQWILYQLDDGEIERLQKKWIGE